MRVVVAICRNAQGEVLLAQRAAHAHLGGTWEFPGGKVEAGESDTVALLRELREEIGLSGVTEGILTEAIRHANVLSFTPWLTRQFAYPDRQVVIQAYRITLDAEQCAQIHGREGQLLRWVRPDAIANLPTPAANAPLIATLNWPPVWHISPDIADAASVMAWVHARCQRISQHAADAPRHGLVLRLPSVALADYRDLAQRVLDISTVAGLPVLLHGDVQACHGLAAFGFHASSQQAAHWHRLGLTKSAVLPVGYRLAVAAHDADELACAHAVAADWAWLSPVLPTTSHPESAGLGWSRWAELAQATTLPVYALGGLNALMLDEARRHGGVGIAGISGF